MYHELSPYVRLAIRSELPVPWRVARRVIFDFELIYLARGSLRLTVGDRVYYPCAGDVILLHPGQPHEIESVGEEPISQPHIHFDMTYDCYSPAVFISFKDLDGFSRTERLMIRRDILEGLLDEPIIRMGDRAAFLQRFFAVIDAFPPKSGMADLRIKILMLDLLATVFAENGLGLREGVPEESRLPAMLRSYIDNNYKNRMTLEGLAAQFNYNKSYLEKCFFRAWGVPIKRYYLTVRAEKIKEELRAGRPIAAIVAAYHFTSVYDFSRFVKRMTGLSPRAYLEHTQRIGRA